MTPLRPVGESSVHPRASELFPPRGENGMVTEKTCSHCGEAKDVSDFARNSRTRDGRSSWCRECVNETKREARRRKAAENLLAEAARLEREAEAVSELRAWSLRATAGALRREAARKAAR